MDNSYLLVGGVESEKKSKKKSERGQVHDSNKKSSKDSQAQKSLLNTLVSNTRLHCMAYCKECVVETSAERQTIICRVCFSPLEYFCAMCKEQFLNFTSVKKHVIRNLEEVSTQMKCSKCCRSQFTTRCSFIKHEHTCKTKILFDKEVLVILERCEIQPDLCQDIKPTLPIMLPTINYNESLDLTNSSGDIPTTNFSNSSNNVKIKQNLETSLGTKNQSISKKLKTLSTSHSIKNLLKKTDLYSNIVYCSRCFKQVKITENVLCHECKTVLTYVYVGSLGNLIRLE